MKRITEPELMLDGYHCELFNQVSLRQYSDGKFLDSYEKYCGFTDGSLIDLGSGPGVHLEVMRKRYPNLLLTGYDNSDSMLELAKRNTSVEVKKLDFNEVKETSDCVLCLYSLHHQHDPIKFWETVKRLSKGNVYVEDFERPEDESMFDSFIAIDDFKHSLRAAFTLEEVEEQLKQLDLPYKVVREVINAEKKVNKLIIYQKT